jgi:DNA primase
MDFVEQLKSSVDIVRTIGEYVRLKKQSGSPRYTGLCPFHTEKSPSFSVHSALQFYKCFGCDAKGDVLNFIMEIERLTFYEALKLLAERNGIPMPKREYSDAESKLHGAVLEMHEIAAAQFQANLNGPAGQEARNYLNGRGVSSALAQEFGLGVSDASGQQLVRKFENRFAPEQLEQSGLVMKRQESAGFYDRFRGRLMFPIHNESGKVIGFGGRALRAGDEPKYLNSPETPLYHKSFVLYNLHRAKTALRKTEQTILVEGYMDVIGVYGAGVHNVVASCGTALTNTQVRAIKRHSERIVVNFDPDAAGTNAMERNMQMLLDEHLSVRVLDLDGELDPDEYVKQFGAQAYEAKLQQAPAYFHWLADRARKKFDMRDVEGRLQAFKFVTPAIQRISDRLERFAVANDVASYLGVDPKLVRDHFSTGPKQVRPAGPGSPVPANEKLLLNSLLASAAARSKVIPQLSEIPAVDRFVMRNVFKTMFTLHTDQVAFRFADLEGRLNDTDRNLLANVVFADELIEEDKAIELAVACLETLKAQDPKAELADLRARIQAAERSGNLEEAMRLMEEEARRSRRPLAELDYKFRS